MWIPLSTLTFLLLMISRALAQEEVSRVREARELNEQLAEVEEFNRRGTPYVARIPYVPPTWDYGLELGSLSTQQNNYWLGLNVGRHLGTCVFSFSQTCQQYADLLTGIGGRESRTHFSSALSLRWQFVNFPTYWSTLARVFVGGVNSIEPEGVTRRWMYGVGIGVTTYLHPRADLRFEARMGHGSYPWGSVMVTFQFKMDKWVEYFADKLKAFGVGTVNVTGQVIKGTVDTTGKVINTTGSVIGTTVETTGKVITTTVTTTGKAVGTAGKAVGTAVQAAGEVTGVTGGDNPEAASAAGASPASGVPPSTTPSAAPPKSQSPPSTSPSLSPLPSPSPSPLPTPPPIAKPRSSKAAPRANVLPKAEASGMKKKNEKSSQTSRDSN